MELPLSKRKQTASRGKKYPHGTKAEMPEELIQGQLDDMLKAYGIKYLRFPDGFFRWLKRYSNATENLKQWFFGVFGGIPDTLAFLPISDKYMLACAIECKTQDKRGRPVGKLHGKQKHWGKDIVVQISRSPDQSIAIVQQFQRDAERFVSEWKEAST